MRLAIQFYELISSPSIVCVWPQFPSKPMSEPPQAPLTCCHLQSQAIYLRKRRADRGWPSICRELAARLARDGSLGATAAAAAGVSEDELRSAMAALA